MSIDSARSIALSFDRVDCCTHSLLAEFPPVMREASDKLELQPLVNRLGPFVIAKQVGGQGKRQLRRAAAAVSPLQPRRRMIAKIQPQIEPTRRLAVLQDDNLATSWRACALIALHTTIISDAGNVAQADFAKEQSRGDGPAKTPPFTNLEDLSPVQFSAAVSNSSLTASILTLVTIVSLSAANARAASRTQAVLC
jgi:hypothetical protein